MESLPSEWTYLTKGREANVYLHPDQLSVVKLNDRVYYAARLRQLKSFWFI